MEVYTVTNQGLQFKYADTTDFKTLNVAMLNFHCEYKESFHNYGTDTIHDCGGKGQWRQSNSSDKFEVQQSIVLCPFALMPLTSLSHFLIYAPIFGPTPFGWFI